MERDRRTRETFDKSAGAYQETLGKMHLYDASYDKFASLIEKDDAQVLDVGCGPGNVAKYLHGKRPDFRIIGIDSAPAMVELARTNLPSATFRVLDCREVGKLTSRFDAIVCGFCIPYLSKQESVSLINDLAGALHPGGLLYLSTMEGEDQDSGYETTSFSGSGEVYIYYHQFDFVESALKNHGFHIVDFCRQKYPDPKGTLTDMIFVARKRRA